MVIAWFTSGPEANILPTAIFSKVKLGTTPVIIALATIIILMVTTGAMVAAIFMNRQERRRATKQERADR